MDWTTIWLVGAIVFATHCLGSITGFGGTVLALPFVMLILDAKTAVPVLVFLAWIMSGYVLLRSHRSIRWKPFRYILGYAAVGFPLGILLYAQLPDRGLKLLLAVFSLVIATRGLWSLRRSGRPGNAGSGKWPAEHPLMRVLLGLGGLFQGAFGTGGPFIVIYAARALPEKALFRVTFCLLWLVMNSVLLVKWTVAGGVWTPPVLGTAAVALPFLAGGTLLGDHLHHRVNERHFHTLVYAVLWMSGVVLLVAAIRQH